MFTFYNALKLILIFYCFYNLIVLSLLKANKNCSVVNDKEYHSDNLVNLLNDQAKSKLLIKKIYKDKLSVSSLVNKNVFENNIYLKTYLKINIDIQKAKSIFISYLDNVYSIDSDINCNSFKEVYLDQNSVIIIYYSYKNDNNNNNTNTNNSDFKDDINLKNNSIDIKTVTIIEKECEYVSIYNYINYELSYVDFDNNLKKLCDLCNLVNINYLSNFLDNIYFNNKNNIEQKLMSFKNRNSDLKEKNNNNNNNYSNYDNSTNTSYKAYNNEVDNDLIINKNSNLNLFVKNNENSNLNEECTNNILINKNVSSSNVLINKTDSNNKLSTINNKSNTILIAEDNKELNELNCNVSNTSLDDTKYNKVIINNDNENYSNKNEKTKELTNNSINNNNNNFMNINIKENWTEEAIKFYNINREAYKYFKENYLNSNWKDYVNDLKSGLKGYYYDDDLGRRTIKATIIVNKPINITFNYLKDLNNKGAFDSSFEKGKFTKEFDDNLKLAHIQYKGKFLFSPRDFLVVNFTEKNENYYEMFACSYPTGVETHVKNVHRGNCVFNVYKLYGNYNNNINETYIEFYALTETGIKQALVNAVLKDIIYTLRELKYKVENL